MNQLVALDLPGGRAFTEALSASFDADDAVLPVDPRLPEAARRRLFDTLRPSLLIDERGRYELPSGLPVEDGDALVVPTSGATGEPKGVVLTHRALQASTLATSARLGVDPSSDRWLCCLPLSHIGGLSVLTRALETGTEVEVHPRFAPDDVRDAVRRGANLVSLVSTALFRLDPETASSFKAVVLGGSAPPESVADNVVSTYGLTETGSGLVYDGVPLDGVDVQIRDGGEIALRGPMLFRAYRDGTSPFDGDGYFATGDLGELDATGHLVVFGRRGDVIVSGGEKIWPAPVEAVIARLEAVKEVALVGVPDPEWQSRAVACVVCHEGTSVTLEELRELVRAELGPVFAPKELVMLATLPRTSIGKVRRGELVASLLQTAHAS